MSEPTYFLAKVNILVKAEDSMAAAIAVEAAMENAAIGELIELWDFSFGPNEVMSDLPEPIPSNIDLDTLETTGEAG